MPTPKTLGASWDAYVRHVFDEAERADPQFKGMHKASFYAGAMAVWLHINRAFKLPRDETDVVLARLANDLAEWEQMLRVVAGAPREP